MSSRDKALAIAGVTSSVAATAVFAGIVAPGKSQIA
jgi:hypothetical protein